MSRSLAGIRVLEFAGLGPTPFAGMMLADLGAHVIQIERPDSPAMSAGDPALDTLMRGREKLALNLKHAQAVADIEARIADTDVVLEGYRPGVMERLGLGPDRLTALNPRVIYARMTGWGQTGPLAAKAGHDINYIALTGGLHMIGPADRPPVPPLNLVGDFGGGGMFVVTGILAALVERATTGRGNVIDAAMVDGAAVLLAQTYAWRKMGFWSDERGTNLLDGAAYFYRCYRTADGKFVAVGAIEAQFHAQFIEGLGLSLTEFGDQMDRSLWQLRSDRIAAVFAEHSRAHWEMIFAPLDACVTPVLAPSETETYPGNAERNLFVNGAPAPAPRFER